jgi:hypothetical protein
MALFSVVNHLRICSPDEELRAGPVEISWRLGEQSITEGGYREYDVQVEVHLYIFVFVLCIVT